VGISLHRTIEKINRNMNMVPKTKAAGKLNSCTSPIKPLTKTPYKLHVGPAVALNGS
jgi:hypothetical protein